MLRILALCLLLLPFAASAQTYRIAPFGDAAPSLLVCESTSTVALPCGTGTTPLVISGTFSASLSGFAPASVGTPIAVTTGGVTGTLPAGTVVVATNAGTTNGAYCALGASSSTAQQYIAPNGGWFAFTVGSATQLSCITSASTTTVNMVGGSGLPTGTGGGSGSSGGGSTTTTAVTPPPATSAGTGKPFNTDLFGGLWIAPEFGGQLVDGTHGLPVAVLGSVAVTGTFFQATQPVSAASLPLPTGAASAAKQPAIGTAGSASTDVLSVQGIASMTPLLVSSATLSTAANQTSELTKLDSLISNTSSPVPAGTNLVGNFGSLYPAGSTPITASATGTTGATTATLTGVSSHSTYICGFAIRANATAAVTGNSTVTGTVTGTLNFTQWTAPNASGIGLTEEVFSPCIISSATNTSIAVISAAPGTGGVVSVTAWGYTL